MLRVSRTSESPRVESLPIGTSELGRPLTVHQMGRQDALLRILVIAGQHGDERFGRMAAMMLLKRAEDDLDLSNVSLSVIPNANPDGAVANTRNNALGIDLNRDHQRLDSLENRALHRHIKSLRPHLIVDVHNYPPRRKHLLSRNWILDEDIFIDIPTHPAVRLSVAPDECNTLFKHVQKDVQSAGFSCERYVLLRPSGRIRHSTMDLRDARNGLALRFGALTVLIEGKQPPRKGWERGRNDIVQAQYEALISTIRWAHTHRISLTSFTTPDQVSSEVPIRFKYYHPEGNIEMTVVNSVTRRTQRVVLPGCHARLKITETVKLPSAYAIPESNRETIEILTRHGFRFIPSSAWMKGQEKIPVEIFVALQQQEGHLSNRTNYEVKREENALDGYVVFLVNHDGGRTLALFLEPDSNFSLRRYADLHLSRSEEEYPIIRIP